MTDNEIIKALECCRVGKMDDCDNCPMFTQPKLSSTKLCTEFVMGQALNIINRQKEEIEHTKQLLEAAINGQETLQRFYRRSEWISVEDRLPEVNTRVLGYSRYYDELQKQLNRATEELCGRAQQREYKRKRLTNAQALELIDCIVANAIEYGLYGEEKPKEGYFEGIVHAIGSILEVQGMPNDEDND